MSTPTTFEAHGQIWTKHTPGDPMPCDGEAKVEYLSYGEQELGEPFEPNISTAYNIRWGDHNVMPRSQQVVGWRYAATPPQWEVCAPPVGLPPARRG